MDVDDLAELNAKAGILHTLIIMLLSEEEKNEKEEKNRDFAMLDFDETVNKGETRENEEMEKADNSEESRLFSFDDVSVAMPDPSPSPSPNPSLSGHDNENGEVNGNENGSAKEEEESAETNENNSENETNEEEKEIIEIKREWPYSFELTEDKNKTSKMKVDNMNPFHGRLLVVKNVPSHMNEKGLEQALFYDVPSKCHPYDIYLFHCATTVATEMSTGEVFVQPKPGYAFLLFYNSKQIEMILPILANKQKFVIERPILSDESMATICTAATLNFLDSPSSSSSPHSLQSLYARKWLVDSLRVLNRLRADLCNRTLRVLFLNLHWKVNALHLHQFISQCIPKAERKSNALVPLRVQICFDQNQFPSGHAVVDFKSCEAATQMLEKCHLQKKMGRTVYCDWYPDSTRIQQFVKQQLQFEQHVKDRDTPISLSLLLDNIDHSIGEEDIRQWIYCHAQKHGIVSAESDPSTLITHLRLVHNRRHPRSSGYCFVKFDPSLPLLQVMHALQYKLCQNRCVYVKFCMFVSALSYVINAACSNAFHRRCYSKKKRKSR
ncbi:rhoptry neck protein 6 [Reticulomyxa filosa]|uniref:Rhoptry neck protein 6 n=1 Tax=Reticulomyxa filosa TaxID=46433 RepID=X6M8B3_RETFI|nr:rhoptry neck protein 6 [Reticulomyxa filosa]|eukprot:ETO10228.1 rhoptry neck protein 6 [Reticulomyxa filosa]